jgi:bifunctional ADP-heptose synthase (sugar kinase/adenylyltransferase)
MAVILVNGCFDLLHEGHKRFLRGARWLGRERIAPFPSTAPWGGPNQLVAAINSDAYARKLKASRWGPAYPIDDERTRAMKLRSYVDEVRIFDNEEQLHAIIAAYMPCILCKGPDYAGKRVTGDDLAPVIILDTPEPESVKAMKREKYGIRA